MKTQTYSEEDLTNLGFEETGDKFGNCDIWMSHDEVIIYDPDSQMIMQRFPRDRT